MSAREHILASVRRSLGRGPLPPARIAELDASIAEHAPNLIPERARLPREQQLDLLVRMAEDVGTTFSLVSSLDKVPRAVADFLMQNGLPRQLRMSPDPALGRIPWSAAAELAITRGPARDDDLVSLTPAFAAVAETGTLALLSGAGRPATLNFLPDTHVVVLEANDVVGSYEEALVKLRATATGRASFMPRTVNFITGPSRTADIALTIVRGAHGPRRLHVVLVR